MMIIFRINILHVYNTMNNADNTDIQSYQGFYIETADPNRCNAMHIQYR